MALKVYSGRNSAVKVYASDWKLFAREIAKLDVEHRKAIKKRWKEIGQEAKQGVVGELKSLGTQGPMKGMRHGGRTGWGTNSGPTGGILPGVKRVPYNSVLVDALSRAKKGQTGIVRLRVRSGATVIADLARKTSGKSYTRPYWKRTSSGELIGTSHTIVPAAVDEMIKKLGPVAKPSKRKKSRNVYPGFDKSYPQIKPKVEQALKEAIVLIEKNIDRTNN